MPPPLTLLPHQIRWEIPQSLQNFLILVQRALLQGLRRLLLPLLILQRMRTLVELAS